MFKGFIKLLLITLIFNVMFIIASYGAVIDFSGSSLRFVPIVENNLEITEMDLSNNEINDLSNLSYYSNLERLFLQRNSLYDISDIAKLPNLKVLSINGNLVESLEPLKDNIKLEKLYAIENNITDVSPLKNMVNLSELYINKGNSIDDYTSINGILEHISSTDIDFQVESGLQNEENFDKQDFIFNFFYSYNSNDQINRMNDLNMLGKNTFITYDYISVNTSGDSIYFNVDKYKSNEINKSISKVSISESKILNSIYNYGNYEKIFKDLSAEELARYAGKNGLVVDFEGLENVYFEKYFALLDQLKFEMERQGKLLIVAIEASKDIEFDKLLEVSDYIILMAHDYDVKNFTDYRTNNNYIYNPQSPLKKIKGDLDKIKEQLEPCEMDKIILQINYSISQWKIKNKAFVDNDGLLDGVIKPNRPSYDLLYSRILKESLKDMKFYYFDNNSKNPFLFYLEDGVNNTIWFEDELSTKVKIDIAKEYGLAGVSIWRIGNIPDYDYSNLNVLEYLKSVMEE